MKKSFYRTLKVGDREYLYKIGKSCVVIVSSVGRKKVKATVPLIDLTGLNTYEVERGRNKGWFSITPKTVSSFIQEHSETMFDGRFTPGSENCSCGSKNIYQWTHPGGEKEFQVYECKQCGNSWEEL